MHKDQAEVIAIKVLGWLAGDDDLMGQFMGLTGTAASELATRAQDPEFLGFVLDFLLTTDKMILDFCDVENLSPDTPMLARAQLPGGDVPNWT